MCYLVSPTDDIRTEEVNENTINFNNNQNAF